jgi:predicted transcriptional regulator
LVREIIGCFLKDFRGGYSMTTPSTENIVSMTTELVSAFAGSNAVPAGDLPTLIRDIHATLDALSRDEPEDRGPTLKPAVSVRKSLASRDHLLSLIDGKPYRTLKRHIAAHGFTPSTYRAEYGLPADYPMIAPSYSEERSAVAKARGLGRKPTPQPPGQSTPSLQAAGKKAAAPGSRTARQGAARPAASSRTAASRKGGRPRKAKP